MSSVLTDRSVLLLAALTMIGLFAFAGGWMLIRRMRRAITDEPSDSMPHRNAEPGPEFAAATVQAVIARTYAVAHLGRHRQQGFDVCDATHCQLYDPARIKTSRFTAVAREAVRETSREVLMYASRPAEALFHADCGGSTTSADAVWGGRALPYLKASPDQQPSLSHRTWRFAVPFTKLREALNRDTRSRVGTRLDRIEIVKGYFEDTLNDAFKARLRKEGRRVGFAFLDCNIVSSYRTCFDFLEEFIQSGRAFVYMDEYYCTGGVPELFDKFRSAVRERHGMQAHFVRNAGGFGALFCFMPAAEPLTGTRRAAMPSPASHH